ncbi:MAG: hypothetical protein R2791_03250 [Saprospiraceae bacterium]
MKNRYRPYFPLAFFFFTGILTLSAQERENTPRNNWSVYVLGSIQFDNSREDGWSKFGLGVQYNLPLAHHLDAFASLDYRRWDEFDIRLLPLYLGPAYRIKLSDKVNLSGAIGAGPQLAIGNDFSLFGAGVMGKAEFDWPLFSNIRMFAGPKLGQALLFHPSHFYYADLMLGLRF